MNHVALVGVHRLQGHVLPVLDHLARHLHGQPLEGLLSLGPVALGVHVDAHPLGRSPVDGVAGQLLDGVQGLAPAADDGSQVLSLKNDLIVPLVGNKNLRSRLNL